jgi:hypothetical protein
MAMTQIVLIHGGKSTAAKLEKALPGARVALVYREGLSESYNEVSGIAHDYPTLEALMAQYAPDWSPGEPLVMLGFSAGAWALRYYLRDPAAREAIAAAIFLDGTYGHQGTSCNLAPYGGVLDFAALANASPASHRLIMTYSQATPGPGICAKAIEQQEPGDGVFVRGYANADHGGQQGIVGPAIVAELVQGWIGQGGASWKTGVIVAVAGALAWLWWRRRR